MENLIITEAEKKGLKADFEKKVKKFEKAIKKWQAIIDEYSAPDYIEKKVKEQVSDLPNDICREEYKKDSATYEEVYRKNLTNAINYQISYCQDKINKLKKKYIAIVYLLSLMKD